MAAADETVVGLCLLKINGMFDLDVTGGRWSTRRAVPQHHTGAGIKNATGLNVSSGSFDEVSPRQGALGFLALRNFTLEVIDKETRQTVALFEQVNWTGIDGSTENASAMTKRSITWNGAGPVAT